MTDPFRSRSRAPRLPIAALGLLLGAAGCAVGPDYRRPDIAVPSAYKENPGWKSAAPSDSESRGDWWAGFGDPLLNDLESAAAASNQTVKQAAANYEEARQIARSDRTSYLPTVSATALDDRTRSPSASQFVVPGSTVAPQHGLTSTTYTAELGASWQPDFWGKIRRTVESDVATAQAGAADLANARLSVEGTLATDYIELRSADDRMRLLEDAVEGYRRSLKITQNKYAVGVSARSDIITAQTQLDSTRAQLIDAGVGRAQLEHAIAVLVGKAPADFAIARRPKLGLSLPTIPPRLASGLLERRPDVAAAEREAASANAKVGIQTAAYFPDISLSATGGYEGFPLNQLITAPFRFWTIGGEATDSILDWGERHDLVLSAKATYEASAANYRQTVLTALQQVEDNLAALRILADEAQVQETAVTEAAQAAQIAQNEYNAGTVDFTTVVTAQVTELTNRESLLTIRQGQLTASVALIQALGGGWKASDLPHP